MNPSGSSRPQPRVCMVLKRAGGLAGMQVQAARLGRRMVERGVDVRFLCSGPVPERAAQRLVAPVAALRGWFPWAVRRYLMEHRAEYDVVHVHGFAWETLAAAQAARRTGRPLVVKPSTAGPGTTLHAAGSWRQLLVADLNTVNAWLGISEATRRDLLRLGVRPDRVHPVPNGVDTEVYRPPSPTERLQLRAAMGVPSDAVVVCAVARLSAHKRVDRLLDAFLWLTDHFPDAHLCIAGLGEQQALLARRAAAHQCSARVRILGGVEPEQICPLLRAADVFVLPSLWEGLSNALLEAMACGVAPLATRVSGSVDLLRSGENGLLIPPGDDAALRAGLAALLHGPELRARLGAAARDTVCRGYSLETTVDRILAVYAQCCSAGGTNP